MTTLLSLKSSKVSQQRCVKFYWNFLYLPLSAHCLQRFIWADFLCARMHLNGDKGELIYREIFIRSHKGNEKFLSTLLKAECWEMNLCCAFCAIYFDKLNKILLCSSLDDKCYCSLLDIFVCEGTMMILFNILEMLAVWSAYVWVHKLNFNVSSCSLRKKIHNWILRLFM